MSKQTDETLFQLYQEVVQDKIASAIRDERRKLRDLVAWCEDCDTPMHISDYYSARDVDQNKGRGLVLCYACCARHDAAPLRVILGT